MCKDVHDSNYHAGQKAACVFARERYSRFRHAHIKNYISQCTICARQNPLKRTAQIKPITANKPWERIQIDCIDLRKHSKDNDGYSCILNVGDVYSKFHFVYPMKNKSADEVYINLKKLFRVEGVPQIVQSDNGKEFINEKINLLKTEYSFVHARGRPRHPQSQGQIERPNQTLVRKLSKCLSGKLNPTRWIDVVDDVVASWNLIKSRATDRSPMLLLRSRCGFNSTSILYDDDEMIEISVEIEPISVEYDITKDNHIEQLEDELRVFSKFLP